MFLFVFLYFIDLFIGGILNPLPFRYLAEFKGKVIDAQTKEPVGGAVVVALYYSGTASPGGMVTFQVDARETLTDEKGGFRLKPALRWFVRHRGFFEGRLIIFKPGYGVFPDHRLSEAIGVNKSWPPPGEDILYTVPKLETRAERLRNVTYVSKYNLPLFIEALNEERAELGLQTISVPEGEK